MASTTLRLLACVGVASASYLAPANFAPPARPRARRAVCEETLPDAASEAIPPAKMAEAWRRDEASTELRETLNRFPGKEEVRGVCGGIYQQGVQIRFLNTVPIAMGAYYKEDVVRSAINVMLKAIVDLSKRSYDIFLDMKFAKVNIQGRSLNVSF